MMADLTRADLNLNAVLLSNYNPAVEARRSADCLIYLVYMLLKGLKDKKSGPGKNPVAESQQNQPRDAGSFGGQRD